MNDIIIYLIGYVLAVGLIIVSVKNWHKDKKRFEKLKQIAKESAQQVAEKLNLNIDEAKDRIAVTPEQFHIMQDIFKDIVYESPKLNLSEKSIFYNSLYQPTFQGQQDYLSNLFVSSGATGSLVIKQSEDRKIFDTKTDSENETFGNT